MLIYTYKTGSLILLKAEKKEESITFNEGTVECKLNKIKDKKWWVVCGE